MFRTFISYNLQITFLVASENTLVITGSKADGVINVQKTICQNQYGEHDNSCKYSTDDDLVSVESPDYDPHYQRSALIIASKHGQDKSTDICACILIG